MRSDFSFLKYDVCVVVVPKMRKKVPYSCSFRMKFVS